MGIKAVGEDLEGAFEETAEGMFSIITDLSLVEEKEEYEFEVEEEDIESLLVQFLSELIYLHEIHNVVFKTVKVNIDESEEKKLLKAKAIGEEIDLEKHDMDTAVKAVSYHELSIDLKGEIKIILDI